MALTEKDIDKFKKLYKEHYGEELNDFVAYEAANKLLNMVRAIYKPIPKADEEQYRKLEKEYEAVPENKKLDYVKHLVEDAKVTEFKNEIGEKKFWELVRKINNRKLLLASDGDFAIDGLNFFFKDLKDVKLAYITTASKGATNLDYLEWHKDKMDGLGIKYEEIDVEGKNEGELREVMQNKNAIFVEGGNTFYLLKAARESGFDKIMQELIEKGVPYIGTSAGSYIVCPTIEMATWKPKQKDRFGVADFSAINVVPFLVTAHYTSEMEEVLKEKIHSAKYLTRILQDGQGILVEGVDYKFIGEGEEIII